MTNSEIEATKIAAKTSQVITIASITTTIFMLIMNIDVTSTIFKVIQLITLFDKLRFINVKIKNSFGDFIEHIGKLFEVNSVYTDDYHLAAVSKYNRFERADYSVIAYRMKPDSIIIFSITLILEMVISCLAHSLTKVEKSDFLGMEKKGKLIRNLKNVSSGMSMMVMVDVLFLTSHQILHQKVSNLLIKAEYLLTYLLSLIIFLCAIWRVTGIMRTLSRAAWNEIQKLVQKEEKEDLGAKPKGQEESRLPGIRGRRPNQNRQESKMGISRKLNLSELDPLGLHEREEEGGKTRRFMTFFIFQKTSKILKN